MYSNPRFAHVADATSVVVDKNGELWLPLTESGELDKHTETVEVAGAYFDVIGFSKERDALLLEPIKIDGAAAYLEEEMESFGEQ